jgi:hypothetical protein
MKCFSVAAIIDVTIQCNSMRSVSLRSSGLLSFLNTIIGTGNFLSYSLFRFFSFSVKIKLRIFLLMLSAFVSFLVRILKLNLAHNWNRAHTFEPETAALKDLMSSIASTVKYRIIQPNYNWFYTTFYRWHDTRMKT